MSLASGIVCWMMINRKFGAAFQRYAPYSVASKLLLFRVSALKGASQKWQPRLLSSSFGDFSCRFRPHSTLIYRVPFSIVPVLQGAHPIYTCVTLVHDPLELWSKNPSFYSKIYLDRWSWLALIFKRFFAPFHLPYSGFSQKIGHTGITNTKKWLDQAVFPCWSNYHTLAGE